MIVDICFSYLRNTQKLKIVSRVLTFPILDCILLKMSIQDLLFYKVKHVVSIAKIKKLEFCYNKRINYLDRIGTSTENIQMIHRSRLVSPQAVSIHVLGSFHQS